jgi:hypothetical protein
LQLPWCWSFTPACGLRAGFPQLAQSTGISLLLANVYRHYSFDLWAQRWRRREATGDMIARFRLMHRNKGRVGVVEWAREPANADAWSHVLQ